MREWNSWEPIVDRREIHARTHADTHTQTCTHTHTRRRTHARADTHAHTHADTHTYTHTNTNQTKLARTHTHARRHTHATHAHSRAHADTRMTHAEGSTPPRVRQPGKGGDSEGWAEETQRRGMGHSESSCSWSISSGVTKVTLKKVNRRTKKFRHRC